MMKRYKFHTCDVFTDTLFGGNQLAVIPAADGLDDATMQSIAREFNYSETTFVMTPTNPECEFRVRIFTPTRELPFAGHPTVGTAHVLAAIGRINTAGESARTVFELGVGPVPVEIRLEGGRPVFCSLSLDGAVEIGPAGPSTLDLAACLGLEPEAIGQGTFTPAALSCGFPFLMVPLRDEESLKQAVLRRSVWEERLAQTWAPDLYLFHLSDGAEDDVHDAKSAAFGPIRSRMFGPSVGVPEDAATGSAAVTLAAFLALFDPTISSLKEANFKRTILQGIEMGRPSRLSIRGRKSGGKIVALEVGGPTVLVSEGELLL